MRWEHIAAAAIGGAGFGVIILIIARRGILSMRYTLGWLFIAACIVLGGLLSGVIRRVAVALGIAPPAMIAAMAGTGLLAITVQLSITVSGLTERVRTLSENCAMLEAELSESRAGQDRRHAPREDGHPSPGKVGSRPTKS